MRQWVDTSRLRDVVLQLRQERELSQAEEDFAKEMFIKATEWNDNDIVGLIAMQGDVLDIIGLYTGSECDALMRLFVSIITTEISGKMGDETKTYYFDSWHLRLQNTERAVMN